MKTRMPSELGRWDFLGFHVHRIGVHPRDAIFPCGFVSAAFDDTNLVACAGWYR